MSNKFIKSENIINFFEKNAKVRFVDIKTGKSVLETIATNKIPKKSDYDVWLDQQNEDVKREQAIGEV